MRKVYGNSPYCFCNSRFCNIKLALKKIFSNKKLNAEKMTHQNIVSPSTLPVGHTVSSHALCINTLETY